MKRKLCFLMAFTLALGVSLTASAGQPRLVSSYESWAAYVFTEEGKKVCYMASKPEGAHGDYSKRGEIFALLTHRPAEGTKNVFSYIAGYTYKPGSDASVDIDGEKFVLFTQEDTAWAPDAETDEKIARAIQGGTKMTVRGTSSRGTSTTDSFTLRGSGKAYERISAECRM
jgi:hypothetical protein